MGVCIACAAACHASHDLGAAQTSRFRCDCDEAACPLMKDETHLNIDIPKVDIILGAELTYNTLSIDALVQVVDHYLKPDGVFYEVLSDDRDGVDLFATYAPLR